MSDDVKGDALGVVERDNLGIWHALDRGVATDVAGFCEGHTIDVVMGDTLGDVVEDGSAFEGDTIGGSVGFALGKGKGDALQFFE